MPTTGQINDPRKRKIYAQAHLETHLLLHQICEDEHDDTPQDPNETNDEDDQSYTTTQNKEEGSDFPQAG